MNSVYPNKKLSIRVGLYVSEELFATMEVMRQERLCSRAELVREAIRRTMRPYRGRRLGLPRVNQKFVLVSMQPALRDYMTTRTSNLSEFMRTAMERMAIEEGYL